MSFCAISRPVGPAFGADGFSSAFPRQNLTALFLFWSSEAEPDKQGRILIPPHLREYAGLTKDVTVIGAATRAEIWATEKWNEYNEGQSQESILEAMELLDF